MRLPCLEAATIPRRALLPIAIASTVLKARRFTHSDFYITAEGQRKLIKSPDFLSFQYLSQEEKIRLSSPPPDPNELKDLVLQGQYEGARRLRIHLLSLQPKNFMQEFVTWLSLVPPKHEAPDWRCPFSRIQRFLFSTGVPADSFPVVTQFSMVTASMGYLKDIWPRLGHTLALLADPASGLSYLMDLERAVVKYEKELHPERVLQIEERYRSMMINACCHMGWLQQAVNLLHKSGGIRLPLDIYQLILDKLREDGDENGVGITMRIIAEQEDSVAWQRRYTLLMPSRYHRYYGAADAQAIQKRSGSKP
ncbi:uncharacterized protein BT62DRAFT_719648 [Guyanagaster necrorhizus]|uniref:Uncharacterized protein n=1 Tax=Guyanagaster necrorhizus TaxID=856835 RepID=A0A9P8AUN4_9AGAR|nr:uncharacterized protein BT62DRAFT_719648 [Guyanagaster necrorhizus MCA 3950]KAG7448653.1 hypothetical protein BT62DRAFT_719648 [Guyanagaster necrorhizus MCA 3950]